MTEMNTQIRLLRRPRGAARADDFMLADTPKPEPTEGQILVRVLYVSLDPALRPRMNAVSDYAGAVAIDETIPSPAIGVVCESRSPLFRSGEHVFGFFGWQRFAVVEGISLRRIDLDRAALPLWMSLLGLSSFTAWIGLDQIGRPKPGETVVVSAASGATGSVVGQIAKIRGARAVGIAGGADKCRYVVDELGFDACIDHRAPDFAAQLDAACPAGIDVDFENVGGMVLRAVYARMNLLGRVVLCGLVSEYNSDNPLDGPNLWPAIHKSLHIEGFRASRFFDRIPEFVNQALAWHAAGRLRHAEHITDGIANAPQAFVDMLSGRHRGKAMVRV